MFYLVLFYLYVGKEGHKSQAGFSELISFLIIFSQSIFKYRYNDVVSIM